MSNNIDKFNNFADEHPLLLMLAVAIVAIVVSLPVGFLAHGIENIKEEGKNNIKAAIDSGYSISLDGVYIDNEDIEDIDVFLDSTIYLGADTEKEVVKFKHKDVSK